MNGQMERPEDKLTDIWAGRTGEWMDGWIDGWTERWMNRQMDGQQTGHRMDRQTCQTDNR